MARPISLAVLAEERTPSASAISEQPIRELTEGMRRGAEEAFARFHGLYAHRLFAYIFVLTRGDEALARELLQQTLIKVARHARVFEEEIPFWNWLAAIARNCWLDEMRKHRRYTSFLERFWTWTAREKPDNHDLAMSEFIDLLDVDERELLERKYLEGLSVRELAMAAGTTEKAVESKLSRVRRKLKELIAARKE